MPQQALPLVRSYKMTYKYELIETPFGGSAIVRTDETNVIVVIPTDPANSDYQAYLNRDTLPSNSSDFSQPIGGNE
jgi:hypothetical protein